MGATGKYSYPCFFLTVKVTSISEKNTGKSTYPWHPSWLVHRRGNYFFGGRGALLPSVAMLLRRSASSVAFVAIVPAGA